MPPTALMTAFSWAPVCCEIILEPVVASMLGGIGVRYIEVFSSLTKGTFGRGESTASLAMPDRLVAIRQAAAVEFNSREGRLFSFGCANHHTRI